MAQLSKKTKYIDVEKSIRESNSKLLKKLPRFVIQIIAKIIKEKEMNMILQKYENSIGIDFLNSIIEEFNINIVIEGLENLPEHKKWKRRPKATRVCRPIYLILRCSA